MAQFEKLAPYWPRLCAKALNALKEQPTPAQLDIMLDATRFKLTAGGERAGKSQMAATEAYAKHYAATAYDAWRGDNDAGKTYLYWLIGEDYSMTEGEFNHLHRFYLERDDVADVSMPKQGSWMLRTHTNAVYETKTASDERKLGVVAPDGVIGCEVGLWSEETWNRARGRAAEERAWFLATGSFENSLSSFARWHKRGLADNDLHLRSFALPTWTNIVKFPGGELDPEIIALRAFFPEDRFNERFAGIASTPQGLVFKLASEKLVANVPLDPTRPVQLWVDPGHSHAYSVLAVQLYADMVNIFDEIYVRGQTHSGVIALCKQREWWKNVNKVVIDRAGKQTNANGASGETVWKREGGQQTVDNYVHIKDGIDRINTFLMPREQTGLPRLVIGESCVGLLAEMGLRKPPSGFVGFKPYSYATTNEGGVTKSDLPMDVYNDSCKALGYGLYETFGPTLAKTGFIAPFSYLTASKPMREAQTVGPALPAEAGKHEADTWLLRWDTRKTAAGLWQPARR